MTAQDHILAWIESSREHYDRLLEISARQMANGSVSSRMKMLSAANLVNEAYAEMVRTGDASREDFYSPADLVLAVALVVIWELEQ